MFAATLSDYPVKLTKYNFPIPGQVSVGTIALVSDAKSIDQDKARSILVESFIHEYRKYLSPKDIRDDLTCWCDKGCNTGKSVQQYYEDYFKKELEKLTQGKIDYWVEASIGGELVGWATFQREPSEKNAVYMDLLAVHPNFQKKGIGTQLVNALINLNETPTLNAIHVALIKKNEGGRIFYTKLGFASNHEYQCADNFVDMNLLESLTWKKPALQQIQKNESDNNYEFESELQIGKRL